MQARWIAGFVALALSGCGLTLDELVPGGRAELNPLDDQTSFGSWEYQAYLDGGWSGYHVRARIRRERPYATYEVGEHTYYIANPRCRSGDCPLVEDAIIAEIGIDRGQRIGAGEPLGKLSVRDDGSSEETRIVTSGNVNLALINESEVQSRLRLDEAQVVTLTGFTSDGASHELGHIEEMDAPGSVTQPESLYRRANGADQFVVTVVERVLGDNQRNNLEWFRLSTRWCLSDAWKQNADIAALLKRDSYDLEGCDDRHQPLASLIKKGAGDLLKQVAAGRSDSQVSLWPPGGGGVALSYQAGSDPWFTGANGSRYYLRQDEDTNLVFANTHVYHWQRNYPGGEGTLFQPNRTAGVYNAPSAKLIHVNWERTPGFEGHSFGGEPFGIGPGGAGARWVTPAAEAVALVVEEKVEEVFTTIADENCQQFWADRSYSIREYTQRCRLKTAYWQNFYILFPPRIRGEEWSRAQKVALLDRILAAMPDQVQQSPELSGAERYLDVARALEAFRAAGRPETLDFDLMTDVATEEDHSAAQTKIWDLFTDLGLVEARAGRPADAWGQAPAGADESPPAEPLL